MEAIHHFLVPITVYSHSRSGQFSKTKYKLHINEIILSIFFQLISIANLICRRRKGNEVAVPDIKKAYTLFIDEARTVQFLEEYSKEFMYNEVGNR